MNYTHFEKHLETINKKIFRDGGMPYHEGIIEVSFKQFVKPNTFTNVLDIGCGTGFALDLFKENGIKATGITVEASEFQTSKDKGHDVRLMDMNFLEFDDKEFDLIWCRHALEHSVMPTIALMEMKRVLKDDGKIYIEVPSDNILTIENVHHYSLLSDDAWQALFRKTGLHLIHRAQYTVLNGTLQGYPYHDIYWYYWIEKE